MSTTNPYQVDGFTLEISRIDIESKYEHLSLFVGNLLFYSGSQREILSLAKLDAKINYKFMCNDENH